MSDVLSNGTLKKHLDILNKHGEAFLREYEELCNRHRILVDELAGDPEISVVDKSSEIGYSLGILRRSLKRNIELYQENLESGGITPVEATIH